MRDNHLTNDLQTDYICDMGLNAIRMENVWGKSQDIFDLCDRKGIMVLPGWTCHWEWEEYLGKPCDDLYGGMTTAADRRLLARYFHDQLTWLRRHPSIICWLVGSDKMCSPELERHYMQQLRQLYPNLPYLTSIQKWESEISGSAGLKMNGPYEYVGPDYWYAPRAEGGAAGFNAETSIGAQLPQKESLRRMLGSQLWPLSPEWDYHCTASQFHMNNMKPFAAAIKGYFGGAAGLDDFLKKADMLNYDATRAMFEAFRAREPKATGIVQWMLNSARPSVYWQLYDHYLVPNAAYYSVRKANTPCQLVYDYDRHAVLVNSNSHNNPLQASIRLYSTNGSLVAAADTVVTAMPGHPQNVLGVPSDSSCCTFLFLTLRDTVGNHVADNAYVLGPHANLYDWDAAEWFTTPISRYADLTQLNSLTRADCKATVKTETVDGHPRTVVSIDNRSGVVAYFMRLSIVDGDGRLVVPAMYSDNYLSLPPHGSRTITCDLSRLKTAKGCRLAVEGWNVQRQELKLR